MQTIRQMVEAGMDGCRINMSHGSCESVRASVELVRRVSAETGRPIAVAADLRGPKLRIGDVVGGRVQLRTGEILELSPEDSLTDSRVAFVDYPYLAEDVRPGDPVLIADGALVLRAEEVRNSRVVCRVLKGGDLTSRKGINFPSIPLRVPSVTERDLQDIAFAVAVGVDFLFLSYARSREHVEAVRAAVARHRIQLPLVAKIERQEGVEALAEIVDSADGICIARGDLGIEIPYGSVPDIQREAARLCFEAGKFVMIGGQVLASMVSGPVPLRAELTDLVTAVRDGLDAVVLSDETATGAYPVEAVRVAAQTMETAEAGRAGVSTARRRRDICSFGRPAPPACGLGAVIVSKDGLAVETMAASRVFAPIVAAVDAPQLANWLATWWGVVPILLEDLSRPALAARRALEVAAARGVPLRIERCVVFYEDTPLP